MTAPVPITGTGVVLRSATLITGWVWRARDGDIAPAEMKTSHLFHTLRMIWNNMMPRHMRVGSVRLYRFGPRHPREYLMESILQIGGELFRREDLTAEQIEQLAEMEAWFSRLTLPDSTPLEITA